MTDRWRDRAETESPEGRAGDLLRSVRPPAPSAELEERVQAVLRGERSAVRPALGRPLPVLAIAAGLFMLAGGATAATLIYQRWSEAKVEPTPAPAPRPIARRPIAPPAPPPPPAIVEAAPPPAAAPTPKPKAPDPSDLALESKQIKAAVDALRSREPARALKELASYERAHPKGLLHREALLAKITALVALDREAEALAILDAAPLDDHPRSLELTILRGELRARASRCADAIGDFEAAQKNDLEEKLRARAEHGLARCR